MTDQQTAPADHIAVADVLDDAADYIEKHGWWNGAPPSGGNCAFLAISDASPNALLSIGAADALASSLGLTGDELESVIAWNDAPGRTEQEILDAFRFAAKAERRLADEAVA